MKRTYQQLVQILPGGAVSRSDLFGFSNISRAEAEAAWPLWASLPVALRQKMTRSMVEIAENDVEANFCELFRLALEDADGTVRQAAVEGLWEDEDARLTPLLAARLRQDPVAAVRVQAAASLGRFILMGELGKIRPQPYQTAFRALMAAWETPEEDLEVRRRAIESLAYSSAAEVVSQIQAAYTDPDERMRVSAVFAMGRSADERWAKQVLREVYSPNPEMRYEAAHACGELALEKAVPLLIELLEDVDSAVQEAAVWSLGQIGGDEAHAALQACLHKDDHLREAAQEALVEFEFLYGDLGAFLLFDVSEDDEDEEEDEDFEDEDL
jgi:HEAT repeat protein